MYRIDLYEILSFVVIVADYLRHRCYFLKLIIRNQISQKDMNSKFQRQQRIELRLRDLPSSFKHPFYRKCCLDILRAINEVRCPQQKNCKIVSKFTFIVCYFRKLQKQDCGEGEQKLTELSIGREADNQREKMPSPSQLLN